MASEKVRELLRVAAAVSAVAPKLLESEESVSEEKSWVENPETSAGDEGGLRALEQRAASVIPSLDLNSDSASKDFAILEEWAFFEEDPGLRCAIVEGLRSLLLKMVPLENAEERSCIACSTNMQDSIQLPNFNLAGLRGFTFVMDLFVCPDDDAQRRGLFRFLTSTGHGVECILQVEENEKVGLLFRTRPTGSKNWHQLRCAIPPGQFKLGRWHQLIIAQSHPYLASPSIKIYIDGVQILEQLSHYPKVDELVSRNMVGQGLGGKFAYPSLYEGAATPHQASSFFESRKRRAVPAPNAHLTIGRNRVLNRKRMRSALPMEHEEGQEEEDELPMVFLLDSRTCIGGEKKVNGIFEGSFEMIRHRGKRGFDQFKNEIVEPLSLTHARTIIENGGQGQSYAWCLGGAHTVVKQSMIAFAGSVEAIGGVVPILALLGHLIPTEAKSELCLPHIDGVPEVMEQDGTVLLSVLRFLSSLIASHHFHRMQFANLNGPRLLSWVLTQVPREWISVSLVDTFWDEGFLLEEPQGTSIFEDVLFNEFIFGAANLDAKKRWMEHAEEFAKRAPEKLNVQWILRLLSFENVADSVVGSLIRVLETVFNPEWVAAIIPFLSRNPRSHGTTLLLEMLCSMLLPKLLPNARTWTTKETVQANTLCDCLEDSGGIEILLAVGSRSNETKLKREPPRVAQIKKTRGPKGLEAPARAILMHDAKLDDTGQRNGLLSANHEVSPRTRAAMFVLIGRMMFFEGKPLAEQSRARRQKQLGILLRSIMPVPHLDSFRLDEEEIRKVSLEAHPEVLDGIVSVVVGCATQREAIDDVALHDDDFELALPDALPVLGGMLAALSKADEDTKAIAARDVVLKLSLVMKASYNAREQVTSLPRWQSWLVPVMLLHEKSLDNDDDNSADYLLGEVAMDLLCTLMEHETQRRDDSTEEARKLNRVQQGWASWQGLAENTLRIMKSKERSVLEPEFAKARDQPELKFLVPEYNAIVESKAQRKTARVLRATLERVWERLTLRLQAGGLHKNAIRNFMNTMVLSEEILVGNLNELRLKPLSAGGVISSSSAGAYLQPGPGRKGKPLECSAKCVIDGNPGTKWVDLVLDKGLTSPEQNLTQSWIQYKYPNFSFQSGSKRTESSKHRIVFYVVRSAFDAPDLDPSGWTLFARNVDLVEGEQGGWMVLDRRKEVRFDNLHQRVNCWVGQTGFFQEYKIVFDPPTRRGKVLKQHDGSKVFAKMQIGEVTFWECDVDEWHRDIPDSTEAFVGARRDVKQDLEDNNGELLRFLKHSLNTIRFIRSGHTLESSPRIAAKMLEETEATGQNSDMPKRSVTRLFGHIFRAAHLLTIDLIEDAISLMRSYLAEELSVESPSNRTLVMILMHCMHRGMSKLGPGEGRKKDSLFAALMTILGNQEALIVARGSPTAKRYTSADFTSVDDFLASWPNVWKDDTCRALERELEAEINHRHISFRVDRISSLAMAKKANPVEVFAYGIRGQGPIGLPKPTRRWLMDMEREETMRLHHVEMVRLCNADFDIQNWRHLLESCDVFYSLQRGPRNGKLLRQSLFRDPVMKLPTRLNAQSFANMHLGSASGVKDRVERQRALRISQEKEDLLGLYEANGLEDWQDFGAKLSKQVEIADTSLTTHVLEDVEEDEGEHIMSDADTGSEDESHKDGEKKSESIKFGAKSETVVAEKRFTDSTSVLTRALEGGGVDGDGDGDDETLSEASSTPRSPTDLAHETRQLQKRLTLEEWVNRSPDPARGESEQPWPSSDENVFAACRCYWIRPEFEIPGRIIVSNEAIYFDPDPPYTSELHLLRPKFQPVVLSGERPHIDVKKKLETLGVTWGKELSPEETNQQARALRRFQFRVEKRRIRMVWQLTDLDSFFLRRYRMRDSAFEIYLKGNWNESFLFDMAPRVKCTVVAGTDGELDVREEIVKDGAEERHTLLELLWGVLPKSVQDSSQKPGEEPWRNLLQSYRRKWRRHKISNFEYLMKLNFLAGRSLNDLTQYPVFPWVLSDYESEDLNLNDATSFRDLSKPMGALTEERLREARERYRTFEDPSTPKFHYGSHYSTMAGVVLYFLVRMEPFTTLHIEMQDGHFDVPDRLFNSVPATWKMCTTVMSEVKELTPEFYALPAFLENHNHIDLGTLHNGTKVSDVELPPWAKGSARIFVHKMRQALESNYVSSQLHLWIDLIFGVKSRLPDAELADNVFYYLTYPGAVDIDSIEDPAMRMATELQIRHFGQCPMQLFSKNHPQRKDSPKPPFPLGLMLSSTHHDDVFNVDGVNTYIVDSDFGAVLSVRLLDFMAVALHERGDVLVYLWGRSDEDAKPHHGEASEVSDVEESVDDDASHQLKNRAFEDRKKNLGPLVLLPAPEAFESRSLGDEGTSCPPVQRLPLQSMRRKLAWSETAKALEDKFNYEATFSWSANGRFLAHPGADIGTVDMYFFDTDSCHLRAWECTIAAHLVDVCCLASSSSTLVTAAGDGSVRVWDLLNARGVNEQWGISSIPRLSLPGHKSTVTSLAVCDDQGLVVSSSKGMCMLNSLNTGNLLMVFHEVKEVAISISRISARTGKVLLYGNRMLFLYDSTRPGKPLATLDLKVDVSDIRLSLQDFKVWAQELAIICCKSSDLMVICLDDFLCSKGSIVVWPLDGSLDEWDKQLNSIDLSPSEEAILVGARNGSLCLIPLPNFIASGKNIRIPVVGIKDVKARVQSAKNAVLSKMDSAGVLAAARGVATEAAGVAQKFAKDLQNVFSRNKN